jgi:hypothetical protein
MTKAEMARLPKEAAMEQELEQRIDIKFLKPDPKSTGPITAGKVSEAVTSLTNDLNVITRFKQGREVVTSDINWIVQWQLAKSAIEAKRNQLGWAGAELSDVESIDAESYCQRFENADIYYSRSTGAHEVHGDIRAKYNALGGPVSSGLGLPVTDEQGTPDGRGRYNHFQRGSIYWTANTGPMSVRPPVRDGWAAQGWETGPFGYPISDQRSKVFPNPSAQPPATMCVFQNGAWFSSGALTAPALVAELPAQTLLNFMRAMLDQAFKEADSNLGIEGGIHIVQVFDYGYGFWASRKRMIKIGVHGFRSIDILPDPTFYLELTLEFGLTWQPSFTDPVDKTLVARLHELYVHTSGVGHEQLHDGLKNGILNKFAQPMQIRTIPAQALLIDVITTMGGALQFLLEPSLPDPIEGKFRRLIFQNQLDSLA